MRNTKLLSLGFLLILFGFYSCEDLEVENLNSPRTDQILSDPTEYASTINSQYGTLWQGLQLSNTNWPLSINGQSLSASWGNWGGRDIGTIPKDALQNSLTYNNRGMFTASWNGMYSVMGPVNNILRLIADGNGPVVVGGVDVTDEVIANATALQGLSLSYLGLLHDEGYAIDENSDIATLSLSDYNAVVDLGIAKLEAAIGMFAGTSKNMTGWSDLTFQGDEAAKVLRGFVAKFEALRARNLGETTANVNWNKVLTNASNYIATDLSPVGDTGIIWWHRLLIQGQDGGWARVSQKMIRMMNQSKPTTEVPYPWTNGRNSFPRITTPDDQRILTDMQYSASVDFSASRGYYFFSNYTYKRYDSYRTGGFIDPMVFLSVNEVGLLRAEALVRTGGSKATAATLINATRVTRGGLAALTGAESNDVLLQAIAYERLVEFSWHGVANSMLYRRAYTPAGNTDAANLYFLEPGSARHLPVPADEQSIFGRPFKTYGGSAGEQ
jgi:hypothetical protein